MRALRWASDVWMAVLAITVLLSAMALGGRLILPRIASAPALLSVQPSDGLTEVTTRIQPVLRFSSPMNPRTVERALHVEPPITARLAWNDDFSTLTIMPVKSLQPDTDYQISIDSRALSRQLAPVEQTISYHFRTAPAPAVLAVLPAAGSSDVAVTSPLLFQFSRPMVAQDALGQTRPFPALSLAPPAAGQATWISTTLALFRPDAPLTAATQYTASLSESLSDLQGEMLGHSSTWHFSTAIPKVLAIAPQHDARMVPSTMPITLTLSQAIDPVRLTHMLTITPTVQGKLESALLPNSTQLVTFTPSMGWQRGTAYTVTFGHAANQTPIIGASWRFEVAPSPALIGRYPGEGQNLPHGQSIRLIFSTPMSASNLQAALRLDPPVDGIQVTTLGSEARLTANLQAATSYTLTLAADLSDSAGTALGQMHTIHFRTAPALPKLELIQSDPHVVQFAPGQPADLRLQLTNLTTVHIDVYDLDEATLVRAAGFAQSDWALFQPERYNRPLRRSWTETPQLPLNRSTEYQLRLADAHGQPFPPGAYYLRMRSPDGPRADMLLLISNTRLALQISPRLGLVWATNVLSTSVKVGLPIAIYQDDALVLESTSNDQGLLTFAPVGGMPHRYTVLARGEQPSLIRSDTLNLALQSRRSRYRAALLTDSGKYQAGDTIHVAGFVRQAITETLRYAPENTSVVLRLTNGSDLQSPVPSSQTLATQLGANGVLSASFRLDRAILPGSYVLLAELGGQPFELPVELEAANSPSQHLRVELPAELGSENRLPARIRLLNDSAPRSALPISWTLSAEVALPVLPPGFAESLPLPPLPEPITGTAYTDSQGVALFTINLPPTAPGLMRYRLRAQTQIASGISTGEALVLANPRASYVAMRPEQRLLKASEQMRVDIIVFDQHGQLQPHSDLSLEIVRLIGDSEQSAVGRTLTTDQHGHAQLVIRLAEGHYLLRAWSGQTSQHLTSRSTVWVAQAGHGRASALASIERNQQEYSLGDTAYLLPNTAADRLLTLTTIASPSQLSAHVQEIRRGETLTHTVTRADLPQLDAHILAFDPETGGGWLFEQRLPAHDPAETLSVSVQTDQQRYLPGSSAVLTITTQTGSGQPLAADLIVALFDAAEDQLPGSSYVAAQQDRLYTYLQPDDLSMQPLDRPSFPPRPRSLVWRSGLHSNAQGQATLALPLPSGTAKLRILVWAASPEAVGQSAAQISLDRSSTMRLELPDFVRPADQLMISAHPDSLDLTQPLSLTLQAQPALINSAPLSQTVSPEQAAHWQLTVQPGRELSVHLLPGSTTQAAPIVSLTRPILSAQPDTDKQHIQDGQVYILRSYLDPLSGKVLDSNTLKLGQKVRIRLSLICMRSLEHFTLYEPFAAGLGRTLIEQSSPLGTVTLRSDQLQFTADQLPPGIYEYSYEQQATSAGIYTQPAPWLIHDQEKLYMGSIPERIYILFPGP